MENEYYFKYKDIYYTYIEESNLWKLSDREDNVGNISFYDAKTYRIDECIEHFDPIEPARLGTGGVNFKLKFGRIK